MTNWRQSITYSKFTLVGGVVLWVLILAVWLR